MVSGMNARQSPEEQTVLCHCEERSRRCQHRRHQRAERRDGDDDRHCGNTDRAKDRRHRICRDEWRVSESIDWIDVEVRGVDRQINRDDGHVPAMMARGSVRLVSMTSPDTYDASANPSYAQSTEISASPKRPTSTVPPGVVKFIADAPTPPPSQTDTSTMRASAANFSVVEMPTTAAPSRTPRMFAPAVMTIAVAATASASVSCAAGS